MSYLLPVSLFVTLEFTRLLNATQVETDYKNRRKDVGEWLDKNKGGKLHNSPFKLESPYHLSVKVKNCISLENL